MVTITITGDRLHLEVEGWDKLWALKSQLELPLAHVKSARVDPTAAAGWFHGLRLPGTQIPGVITAGTFWWNGESVFYDVHDPEKTIVIELDHEHYARLVVEVHDPAASAQLINTALDTSRKH